MVSVECESDVEYKTLIVSETMTTTEKLSLLSGVDEDDVAKGNSLKVTSKLKRRIRKIFFSLIIAITVILVFVSIILIIIESRKHIIKPSNKKYAGFYYHVDSDAFEISTYGYERVKRSLPLLKSIGVTDVIVDDFNNTLFDCCNYYDLRLLALEAWKRHMRVYLNVKDIGSLDSADENADTIKKYCYPFYVRGRMIFDFSHEEITAMVTKMVIEIGKVGVAGIYVAGLPSSGNFNFVDTSTTVDKEFMQKLKNAYKEAFREKLSIIFDTEHFFSYSDRFDEKDIFAILNTNYLYILKSIQNSKNSAKHRVTFPSIASEKVRNIWSSMSNGFQNILPSDEEYKFITGFLTFGNGTLLLYTGDELGVNIAFSSNYSTLLKSLNDSNLDTMIWFKVLYQVQYTYLPEESQRVVYGSKFKQNLILLQTENPKYPNSGVGIMHNYGTKSISISAKSIKEHQSVDIVTIYRNEKYEELFHDQNANLVVEPGKTTLLIYFDSKMIPNFDFHLK